MGVYTHNDQMAFGAIQAIKEAGARPRSRSSASTAKTRPSRHQGGECSHRGVPARCQGIGDRGGQALLR